MLDSVGIISVSMQVRSKKFPLLGNQKQELHATQRMHLIILGPQENSKTLICFILKCLAFTGPSFHTLAMNVV